MKSQTNITTVLYTCLSLVILFFLSACSMEKSLQTVNSGEPQNIILMIGDGMGLSQISAYMYRNGNSTVFEEFPVSGIIKTKSLGQLITDSAAGATAFACGEKTDNGYIAMRTDKTPMRTILEQAEKKDMKTGLVVTCTITHATPAAFYAHNESRQNYEEIAEDFIGSGVDYAAGYGREYFEEREDNINLLTQLKERGYFTGQTFEPKPEYKKVAALMNGDPPDATKRPSSYLQVNTKNALEFLSAGDNGFFLMVEGSQIDWGGHANDAEWMLDEMEDFESAVKEALKFAKKAGNTLVIVTADHETGGLSITDGDVTGENIEFSYSTDHHTGVMVPVFAYGPGSEIFSGLYDNTEIYRKMVKALKW